jgi:anaerobic magnesium-protoporphyrin IX monomethyl ester cyclase
MNEFRKNIILLNLPNAEKITRRYMCSYASPHSLFPPYELISIGGVLKEKTNHLVYLIDAIADQLSINDVLKQLRHFKADVIISLTGFECLSSDIEIIKSIRFNMLDAKLILIGHYPTVYPEEILKASKADYILHGEPDLKILDLLNYLSGEKSNPLEGISYLVNCKLISAAQVGRIKDINALPIPDFDLVSSNNYGEPLLPKPFGVIQSARGCPYQCNFCVKTYGTKLTEKSPERIIEELKALVKAQKVKSFRFTDDTFTLNSNRVIQICKNIIAEGLDYIQWTCLSRTDNINKEVLHWMKKAGCRRIYFGVESGSPAILGLLNKNTDVEKAIEALLLTKKYGIETSAFFMLGVPTETKKDIDMSIEFAIKARIDFISIGKFTPYPGTSFYEIYKKDIEFNIYPYQLVFNDGTTDRYEEYEKYFLKKFYLRKSYFSQQFKLAYQNPKESVLLLSDFLSYSFGSGNNALGHIQKVN